VSGRVESFKRETDTAEAQAWCIGCNWRATTWSKGVKVHGLLRLMRDHTLRTGHITTVDVTRRKSFRLVKGKQ